MSIITLTPSHTTIERQQTLHLHARVTAPTPENTTRPDIDLVCVLDSSGSMGSGPGSPWQIAWEAAEQALAKLSDGDRFGLVVYDNDARVIVPVGTSLPDAVKRMRDHRRSSGGTNMEAGLRTAVDLIGHDPSRQQRFFVLSDGQANIGETNPAHLGAIMEGVAANGQRTSAFGLGAYYNEQLMVALAAAGRAGFHHITDGDGIGVAFATELEEMMLVSMRDARLHIDWADGTGAAEALGYGGPTEAGYAIGDLAAGRVHDGVFTVTVDVPTTPAPVTSLAQVVNGKRTSGNVTASSYEVGHARLTWKDVDGTDRSARSTLTVTVGDADAMAASVDADVLGLQAELAALAEEQQAAEAMADGRYGQAGAILNDLADRLEATGSTSARLRHKVAGWRGHAQTAHTYAAAPVMSVAEGALTAKDMRSANYLSSRSIVDANATSWPGEQPTADDAASTASTTTGASD